MINFLDKYKSVYNVFLDNWSYQSHYVMFLEKLLYEETVLPVHIKEMIFGYISSSVSYTHLTLPTKGSV